VKGGGGGETSLCVKSSEKGEKSKKRKPTLSAAWKKKNGDRRRLKRGAVHGMTHALSRVKLKKKRSGEGRGGVRGTDNDLVTRKARKGKLCCGSSRARCGIENGAIKKKKERLPWKRPRERVR